MLYWFNIFKIKYIFPRHCVSPIKFFMLCALHYVVKKRRKEGNAFVKLFKEQLFWPKPRNTRLPDNNQERRHITIELNLNALMLCDGESLPVSSLTFNLASSKTPPTIRASP